VQGAVKNLSLWKIFIFKAPGNSDNDECVCWLQIVTEWKKLIAAGCEAIFITLQVRIFQEVLPKIYVLIYTKVCN
jgi:hypothetical protein